MIDAEEMRIISSILDDIQVLKKRVEEIEERLQILADLHGDSNLEAQEEYIAHLDELEENGEFEEFHSIEELKNRVEKAEN
jgi:hypothetical protein